MCGRCMRASQTLQWFTHVYKQDAGNEKKSMSVFSKFKVISLNVLFTAFTQVLYLSKVLRYLFFTWTSLHHIIEATIVLLLSHLLDNFGFMLLSRLHPASAIHF